MMRSVSGCRRRSVTTPTRKRRGGRIETSLISRLTRFFFSRVLKKIEKEGKDTFDATHLTMLDNICTTLNKSIRYNISAIKSTEDDPDILKMLSQFKPDYYKIRDFMNDCIRRIKTEVHILEMERRISSLTKKMENLSSSSSSKKKSKAKIEKYTRKIEAYRSEKHAGGGKPQLWDSIATKMPFADHQAVTIWLFYTTQWLKTEIQKRLNPHIDKHIRPFCEDISKTNLQPFMPVLTANKQKKLLKLASKAMYYLVNIQALHKKSHPDPEKKKASGGGQPDSNDDSESLFWFVLFCISACLMMCGQPSGFVMFVVLLWMFAVSHGFYVSFIYIDI
jgi:hypothetical protein